MTAVAPTARPSIDAVRRACARWRADQCGRAEPMTECQCEYPTSHSSLGPCREAVRLAAEPDRGKDVEPMENQHRHIKGYRDLSPAEITAMNDIKAKAAEVGELVQRVFDQSGSVEGKRWASIAKTELQQGFMALTRAVALPDSF